MSKLYNCTNCHGHDEATEDVIKEREDLCLICHTLKINGKEYIFKKEPKKDKLPYGHLHFKPTSLRREKPKKKKRASNKDTGSRWRW